VSELVILGFSQGHFSVTCVSSFVGYYYRPLEPNFPAADALCSKGLLQYTIDDHHDIKDVLTFKEMIHINGIQVSLANVSSSFTNG
jgi:hypothetical protein